MPTLKDLSDKVDELQSSLDTEQQAVTDLNAQKDATIAALNQTISDLQAIIDAGGGGTDEERQAVLDKLVALKEDLEATVS